MSPNSTNVTDDRIEDSRAKNGKKAGEWRTIPEKKFEVRNSLLTDLFEHNPHIKTIYHIFIAILLCLFVNTVAHDYLRKGKIQISFPVIYLSFGKLHIALLFWVGFLITTWLCYACFVIWTKIRISLPPKSNYILLWDAFWMLSLIGYYVASFRVASLIVTTFRLPPASAAIVLLEQVRFLMKIHGFVRSSAPKFLNYKPHSDQQLILPSFWKFSYFLFAPTLIYRDQYPRTKTIRWDFVRSRALEVIGVILYYNVILYRFLLPTYDDFAIRTFTWNEIVLSVFENAIVGILLFVWSFFLLLHSVQNLFAELLRFGDRMFYEDWWTCTSYSDYLRMWNIVVYDWLHQYIYKDMYEIVLPRSKTVAKLTVFILSCMVHEWVLMYMLGFFLPALCLTFFFAACCMSFVTTPKKTIVNVLFWYQLIIGSGGLVSVYTLEYFARQNSPVEYSSLKDYLLPRFLTCDCIK